MCREGAQSAVKIDGPQRDHVLTVRQIQIQDPPAASLPSKPAPVCKARILKPMHASLCILQDERTRAELAEAMAALDIIMRECKGMSARRVSLETQVSKP